MKRSLPSASLPIDAQQAAEVDWKTLPPCPIQGFTLRDVGLYDLKAKDVLNGNEVRMLINELAALEGKVLQRTEMRLTPTGVQRINDATLLITPFILAGFGAGFAYKTVKAHDTAFPQKSMMVRYWLQKRYTPAQLELFCARNSFMLNLTNSRVSFFLGVTTVAFGLSAFFWPYRRGEGEYDANSREELRYFRHVEDALKWAFVVYHCHPSYHEERVAQIKENSSPKTAAFPKVNLQRHRVGKLREGE